jgi:hypothetical protein
MTGGYWHGEPWDSASLIILNIKSHKQFFEIFYYLFIDPSGISHYYFHLLYPRQPEKNKLSRTTKY